MNILLTGAPGVGKTTAIKQIVRGLETQSIMGFWSSEIREKGRRVGFAIDTYSGKSGILAHVDYRKEQRVGKYGVNVKDIDSIIIPELAMARESGSIIIIDEIASMELFSIGFVHEVRKCLDTKRVIGSIQKRKHPFLNEVRSRNDVRIIELTIANRSDVPQQVLELIK